MKQKLIHVIIIVIFLFGHVVNNNNISMRFPIESTKNHWIPIAVAAVELIMISCGTNKSL